MMRAGWSSEKNQLRIGEALLNLKIIFFEAATIVFDTKKIFTISKKIVNDAKKIFLALRISSQAQKQLSLSQ
jgi:hypothetical protein